MNEELLPKYIGFLVPFLPMYKEKDEHFTQFIIKHFPEFLEKIEAKLTKIGGKCIVSDQMTIADCFLASTFLKLAYNDLYEN